MPIFKPGDIVYVNRGVYKHYGVYIGSDKLVHFAPLQGAEINAENAVIHEVYLRDFLKGGKPEIDRKSKAKFSGKKTAERALSQVGSKGYSLVFNNCEHFARWCKTGETLSNQVNAAVDIAVEAISYGVNLFEGTINSNDNKKLLKKIEKFIK